MITHLVPRNQAPAWLRFMRLNRGLATR